MISREKNIPVIILAGGFGTRLRSVVDSVPKPMAPVEGRPFLEYQLEHLELQGVRNVVLAVGYMADVIENHFGDRWRSIDISYSHEKDALGTGGSLIKACERLPKKTSAFAMNGDTYFPISFQNMHSNHISRAASVSIAVFKSNEEERYSSFETDEYGKIFGLTSSNLALKSAGIYLFSAEVIDVLKSMPIEKVSFEEDIMRGFWSSGVDVFSYSEDCEFVDIGVPIDYQRAGDVLLRVFNDRQQNCGEI